MSTGTIHPLLSGGVLVDVGDEFPVWRADTGAARRLLLELDLRDTTDHPATAIPGQLTAPPFGEPAAGPVPTGPAATNLQGDQWGNAFARAADEVPCAARPGVAFTSG